MSEQLKDRVGEAIYNGTLQRILFDESMSPLGKLGKALPEKVTVTDNNPEEEPEPELITHREFTERISKMLVVQSGLTGKTASGSGPLPSKVKKGFIAEEEGGEPLDNPCRASSIKPEDMVQLERKMQQLVADRKRDQDEQKSSDRLVLLLQVQQQSLAARGQWATEEDELDDDDGRPRFLYTDTLQANPGRLDLESLYHADTDADADADIQQQQDQQPHEQQHQQDQEQQIDEAPQVCEDLARRADDKSLSSKQPRQRPLANSSPRPRATIASVIPIYSQQQQQQHAPNPVVSANAFSRRLNPTSSSEVIRGKKLRERFAAGAPEKPHQLNHQHHHQSSESQIPRGAYEFSLDFPAPPVSRLAAARHAHELLYGDKCDDSSSSLLGYKPAATSPSGPRPSATCARPESFSRKRIVTLSLDGGEGETPTEETAPGRWVFEKTNVISPHITAAPSTPPPRARHAVRQLPIVGERYPYPVATLGGQFEELVFDPQSMSLILLNIKDGSVTGLLDVEFDSVIAVTASKFADMVTLKSPQSPRGDGYVGTIPAKVWSGIVDKARKAKIHHEHFPARWGDRPFFQREQVLLGEKQKQVPGGVSGGTQSPWSRRKQILQDSSFSHSKAGGRGVRSAGPDLSNAMTIFNMTSLPLAGSVSGRGSPGSLKGKPFPPESLGWEEAAGNASPRAPSPAGLKPPTAGTKPLNSIYVPAYSSSRAARLLLIESREAMQIYFRVKLQPFFRAVDCVESLADALDLLASLPKNHYILIFLNCIDMLHDDTPYESMKRLGGVGGSLVTTLPGGGGIPGGAITFSGKSVTNSLRTCVYGVPNYAETGEEMLNFIETLSSCGVSDILDEPFTYEQIQQVVSKIV